MDRILAALVSLGFAAAGVAILVAAGWSIALSVQSDDWPVTTGIVQSSALREGRPDVSYAYEADGRSFTSSQIGFDVFGPGGRGRTDSILARYPVGAQVSVHVRPDHPEQAVLETGAVTPFAMPLVFGALFLGAGLLMGFRTVNGPVHLPPGAVVAGITAVIAVSVGVSFLDSAVQETLIAAFGTLWIPVAGTAILLLPVPYVVRHRDDRRVTTAARAAYLLVVLAWVAFAAWRGV